MSNQIFCKIDKEFCDIIMKENSSDDNDVKEWVMPNYLEKYRELINETNGIKGIELEELMNDHTTLASNDMFRVGMIVSVNAQILLLEKMYKLGYLK